MSTPTPPVQAVAIIGGATAGAEVAARLAERGILVCVFEQNQRPFGKIEDGLPRWHTKLRDKEYARITGKLSAAHVEYVPATSIGRDIAFEDLLTKWGFAAVVLANGAWRDRPLDLRNGPLPEALVGQGFEYQNPFVIAFNHEDDACFKGRRTDIPRGGGCVIGGGLAAIDVAKILNLEAAREGLDKRGIAITIAELEHHGIDKTLEENGLAWDDLGVKAATVFYRRRIKGMAVVAMPDGASAERQAKIEATREKFIAKVQSKFLIEIEPLAAPHSLVVHEGRVTGLKLARTAIRDGHVISTDESFEVPASIVVSSIGSIPLAIEGLPMTGELYATEPQKPSNIAGYDNVFAVGNVLTGKGNIAASRHHATAVSEEVIEAYLGVADEPHSEVESDPHPGPAAASAAAAEVATDVLQQTAALTPLAPEALAKLRAQIAARQTEVGYTGDLSAWIDASGGPC